MKLNKITEITNFLATIDKCTGNVYLTSQYGDKINLKSKLSQYIAVAGLLNSDNDLELWCDNKEDESKFMGFFIENPDTV